MIARNADLGRHRRCRLSRFSSLRCAAGARSPGHLCRQPRDGLARRTSSTSGRTTFVFMQHDITVPIRIEEPVDFVYHLASPASPIDYLRLPLQTLEGRLVRDAQRARPGEVQARPLPARLDERGLRRSADASAAGDVLGQRQPDRPPRRLRRGEALRRGADDGLPPPAGRRHRIVRIFNTYGPRMRPHDGRAIPTFVRQAMERSRSPSSATARRRGASATSTT